MSDHNTWPEPPAGAPAQQPTCANSASDAAASATAASDTASATASSATAASATAASATAGASSFAAASATQSADASPYVAAVNQQQSGIQPKKSHGWIVAIVIVLVLFALLAVGIVSCTSVVESSLGNIGGISGLSGYTEDALDGIDEDCIGVISIDGTIQYDGSTCSPEGLKDQLDRAAENDHIKAVVLRVDSGGGTATAGEEMATYVKQFREETGKPVVVSSASINASAAYEISSQCDYIYVAKTTEIGSIGTAFQVTDLSGLMEKLGVNVDNITSSDSKDSSYGTRALTDEERAYYQSMVDQINEVFIENVAEGRHMTVDAVRELATGLVFTGMDAVENGLADEIGTKEDAYDKAAELAGIKDYETVGLYESGTDFSSLMDLLSESKTNSTADLAEALKEYANNDNVAE